MKNTPALETERLILRRFTPADIPEIHAIFSDPEVTRFVPCRLVTMAEAEAYYREHYEKIYSQPQGCAYAVCLKESGEVIGYVNCPMAEPYDFGYGYKKEHWRQGYASEGARAVIAWLREAGLPYITATHDVENPHSGKVMEALGMTYRYSYREQWQPRDMLVTFRMYQLDLNGENATYMGYWNRYPEHFVEELSQDFRERN